MDVCGEGLNIHRSHMLQLAQQGGLNERWAGHRLDAMLEVVDQWTTLIHPFDIRQTTARGIQQAVLKQRLLLANA